MEAPPGQTWLVPVGLRLSWRTQVWGSGPRQLWVFQPEGPYTWHALHYQHHSWERPQEQRTSNHLSTHRLALPEKHASIFKYSILFNITDETVGFHSCLHDNITLMTLHHLALYFYPCDFCQRLFGIFDSFKLQKKRKSYPWRSFELSRNTVLNILTLRPCLRLFSVQPLYFKEIVCEPCGLSRERAKVNSF